MIKLTKPVISANEISAVTEVLKSGNLVQGTYVRKFEKMVTEYLGIKYAVAVSSGTAALHLTMLALEFGQDDEVIVPDFTFPATANAIVLAGAKPVLVDIDPKTYNIDVNKIEEKITDNTVAIMPVHLFGQSANMNAIGQIARGYGLWVIEDAACALGAKYENKKCGTMSDVACFSFHPRKIITTGEGGVIVTDNKSIATKARMLRNHGMVGDNFLTIGFNYRMSDIHAAIGCAQMEKLDKIIKARRTAADLYKEFLKNFKNLSIPFVAKGNKHIYQSYVIRLMNTQVDRDRIIGDLKGKGIEATIGTYALHQLQSYKEFGEYSESLRAFWETLTLPIYWDVSVAEVVQSLEEILK